MWPFLPTDADRFEPMGETEAEPKSESQKVHEYRLERFRELGFTPRTARMLEEKGVDWHDAENLLKAGCRVDTAYKILRS